jgi:predicted nucleic acid-binding Zn ribbon protein
MMAGMSERRHPTARQRLRHALISAWRGAEDGPVIDLPTQTVADLVGRVIAQAGLGDRMKLEEVLAAWREIVGDFLFQHSRPESIQRGVLTVRVLQPTFHHVLSTERQRILRKLQALLKNSGIKDIRLKHG